LDERKNETNISKHGFDFHDAPTMFRASLLVALDESARDETRFMGIGLLGGGAARA